MQERRVRAFNAQRKFRAGLCTTVQQEVEAVFLWRFKDKTCDGKVDGCGS